MKKYSKLYRFVAELYEQLPGELMPRCYVHEEHFCLFIVTEREAVQGWESTGREWSFYGCAALKAQIEPYNQLLHEALTTIAKEIYGE